MKKSLNLIFLISPSIILCYVVIYVYYYQQLPEVIVGHRDLTGKIDGYTEKSFIWIPILFNIVIVSAIRYLIGKPMMLNYPVEINDNNRDSAYGKMQIFLSISAIIVSASFSLIIFDAIGLLNSTNALYFVLYFFVSVVGLPLFIAQTKL
ncbi:MAG: DUF1648 domain-containing protein [Candidatus Pedobacter colombiensis]|uniref:DUF1648 domain-containing protein n=1 Tax=Candidatus Pedobacter colombiensis TaxID=3121371 RepID=A0AAJ6B6N7_9SPHI|nr:DUF1648 domain-containing protein [Pedobacter sp.]WEK18676.1 MAG: DUF1648 domain-containing protein [Pedobacter sp.]